MKFECKSHTLVSLVNSVSKARSKQSTQSYLQDIHMEVEDHMLTLRATNLEIFCEKSLPVKGVQNGKCILQGETFVKIIQLLNSKDENLECELIDGVFKISRSSGTVEIKTTTYEDFPNLPNAGDKIGEINTSILTSLIKEVSFCSATTEIKPEIASVYIYSSGSDTLTAVATDSYRLAEKTVSYGNENNSNNNNDLNISFLIPQKYIADILSILSDENEIINLYKKDGILTIISDNGLTLCIRIITGQFPDYKQLFPKEFLTNVITSKTEVQKALNLTTHFTEMYSQVKCNFTNNTLTLHSKNEKIGQVTNNIETIQEGEDIEASYNNKYFLDVFPHINGEKIKLCFTTSNKPLFIKSMQDVSFVYLLMPLIK